MPPSALKQEQVERSPSMDRTQDTMAGTPYTDDHMTTEAERASDRTMEFADKTGDRTKEKASELGARAQERADEGMDKAAGGLEQGAGKLREKAQERGGMAGDAGVRVADSMEKTATYLREHDSAELLDDIEKYVRDHPVQAVAGAVVGGFLIGRILR
jgi:ElaB/YqjD/DUF883 family membrane-anchored ribosome-binding protein